jgi:hypothetical protein
MAIRYVDRPLDEIRFYPSPDDPAAHMTPQQVEDVAEIFRTPLVGSYAWEYESADRKIRRLYELGKQLNWNATLDVDWTAPSFAKSEPPTIEAYNPFIGYAPWEELGEARQLEFAWHSYAWTLSQFLHGEQGALLVASQLVSCAPTFDGKLYAASQTFDEARHVEVFSRYLRDRVGIMYPINPNLKALLDKVLSDERWDLKFIGMQIIIEGLALAAFNLLKMAGKDPLFLQLLEYVIRDEARHVAFGVTYMEELVKSLTPREIEERAEFSYEACIVMRERLIADEVHVEFGMPSKETRELILASSVTDQFRNLLFTRIVPNLKRVGLLTDTIRTKYDALGLLQFENFVDDGMIDWAQLGERDAAE